MFVGDGTRADGRQSGVLLREEFHPLVEPRSGHASNDVVRQAARGADGKGGELHSQKSGAFGVPDAHEIGHVGIRIAELPGGDGADVRMFGGARQAASRPEMIGPSLVGGFLADDRPDQRDVLRLRQFGPVLGERHPRHLGRNRLRGSACFGPGLGVPGLKLAGGAVQEAENAGAAFFLHFGRIDADGIQEGHCSGGGKGASGQLQETAAGHRA